ncbi:MAG: hypothetical protein ACMXYC_03435 [Candidatus Woesearchaeota archaeon]
MAKMLVFDTGPIITLALNNLLWVLPELKKRFQGEFLIPQAVFHELIERPLTTKKYKLEALQILPYIHNNTFRCIHDIKIQQIAHTLSQKMNSLFSHNGHPITIVHAGEIEAIACVIAYHAQGLVVDERNTRYLIETPNKLHQRMQKKLHTTIDTNKSLYKELQQTLKTVKVMRSIELITVLHEVGTFKTYNSPNITNKQVLEALLWAMKLQGCAITEKEIGALLKYQA